MCLICPSAVASQSHLEKYIIYTRYPIVARVWPGGCIVQPLGREPLFFHVFRFKKSDVLAFIIYLASIYQARLCKALCAKFCAVMFTIYQDSDIILQIFWSNLSLKIWRANTYKCQREN